MLLHRDTSPNFKTSLKLNIKEMNLQERQALKTVIGLATLPVTDKNQRRVQVTYWNDEELEYKTGVFYIHDTTYTIHRVDEDSNDIEYNGHTIELTEY